MQSNTVENLLLDYKDTASYVELILNILPEEVVPYSKKIIVMQILEGILTTLTEEEVAELKRVSAVFSESLSLMTDNEKLLRAKYLYDVFLEKMIFNSSYRKIYLRILHECIKTDAGIYQEKDDSNFYRLNDNAISSMYIR